MKTQLYQIFDTIAAMPSGPIMGFPRVEAAIRFFNELASGDNTELGQAFRRGYGKDFVLLNLGEQDLESGKITADEPMSVWGGDMLLEQLEHKKTLAERTPLPAPAANDNTAADASSGVVLEFPTPEEMGCTRCGKHWTIHTNGRCPDNGGLFEASPALKSKYEEYRRTQGL